MSAMFTHPSHHWSKDAVFYHIYPLGHCGAPPRNEFESEPVGRLEQLHAWLPHLKRLGVNALYLGPVFDSSAHGYDTADYFTVDRRLGTNNTLRDFAAAARDHGIRLVLDGVFHHVGRDFWAFRDVVRGGEASPYRDWFHLDFSRRSPHGDAFAYEGWDGHYDLVKLNLSNPEVRAHLFGAVEMWINEFGISGLRLDAADRLEFGFMRELARECKRLEPDFWLMGEVVHGDYRSWVGPEMLDAVTNYELYKGLWSSHADRNYFELAYSLKRQFGEGGVYQDFNLYTFADNHDVNRVASLLNEPAHLYPLYLLLFTMPGTPSVYAGSEWGLVGKRTHNGDRALRPKLELNPAHAPHPDLEDAIIAFSHVRHLLPALRYGCYKELHVNHQQFAFLRRYEDERVVVAVNAAAEAESLELNLPGVQTGTLVDMLNPDERFDVHGGHALVPVPSRWGRVMRLEG